MDIQRSVEDLVSDLGQAVSDGRDYIDRLQQKMDEIEQTKDSLETYLQEAEDALGALENLNAGDLDSALEDAANLVD